MADKMREDTQPWFLRPNYDASEIVIEADGSVRGGTVAALVERLTAHEQAGEYMLHDVPFLRFMFCRRHHLQQSIFNDL